MTRVKKKEQTSPDKRQLSLKGQNRWFAGALANIEKPKYAILIVTALSFATRLYYIHEPAHICWDETHFGKMASWYINRTFFFDVHPPLGKMLIALSGHLTGYDGRFAFDKPGDRATLSMTKSHQSAIIAGLLVVFDNGMITLTRYILLDPPLLFFIAASVLSLAEFSFNIGPRCDGRETFSWRWWFWLVCTGVSIACAFSIKFVGLFIVTQIGLRTIYDIWVILGDTKKSITYFIKHFAARTLCLILLPICLYVTFFWFHINQLNHSGNGDGFYSSAFQSQLIGNSLYNSSSPAHLAYGAEITIKNNRIGGAYLHSHWHLYPEGIGARQQQVTTYSHKDSNNNWLIKRGIADQRPEDVFVRDGDLVVLEHKITRRNLHSHFEAAPLTKRHYQVTCYGESGLGDANDVWQIQKESSSISTEDDRIYTVKSKFKLVHYLTNCALHSHSKQLPKWAYEQMEVTCNPKLFDRNNLWNIEDNYYPNLPNVSFQEYAPSFIDKFIESHAVMLQGNAGLKPKEGEVTSRPWQWPLNYKGQFFSASKGHKIYLLGNPVIWWTNLAVIPVSILMIISLTIIERIKHSKNNQTANLKDRMASTSGIEHNYLEAGIWTLIGWALHYVPFYFMGRVLYFHHYFPAFLFSCMLTAMTFDYLMTILCIKLKTCLKIDLSVIRCEVAFILVAVIVHTFARFVPLTYGSKIDSTSEESAAGNTTTESWRNEQHLSSLKWLDSWEF